MEKCIFFAVRTELLNMIWTSFGFKGLNGSWFLVPLAAGRFYYYERRMLITVLKIVNGLYSEPA
jgi:hypothetical protein